MINGDKLGACGPLPHWCKRTMSLGNGCIGYLWDEKLKKWCTCTSHYCFEVCTPCWILDTKQNSNLFFPVKSEDREGTGNLFSICTADCGFIPMLGEAQWITVAFTNVIITLCTKQGVTVLNFVKVSFHVVYIHLFLLNNKEYNALIFWFTPPPPQTLLVFSSEMWLWELRYANIVYDLEESIVLSLKNRTFSYI